MKVEIPQVAWQGDRESIFSVDFLPFSDFFVTCGDDNDENMYIRFWKWERNGMITLYFYKSSLFLDQNYLMNYYREPRKRRKQQRER